MRTHIRPMRATDAAVVAALSAQLDYRATEQDILRRWSVLCDRPDNAVFIAEAQDSVAGWAHVTGVRLLETDGYAEIGGIVVDTRLRRRGTGRALVAACESWAVSNGYSRLRLRSGLHREEAHRFYAGIGYDQTRASYMFQRTLPSSGNDAVDA